MSLSKLLALVGILIAVWTLFRWVQRMSDGRRQGNGADRLGGARRPERRAASRREPDAAPVEDLVACAGCGAYVAARGARGCGRQNCPYPG